MRTNSGILPGIDATSFVVVLFLGCSKPQVEMYTIPSLPPRLNAPTHWREVDTSQMLQAEKQRFEIKLRVDAGGVESNASSALAIATLTVMPGRGDLSREEYLRINVNRWRGQLGLPEKEDLEDHSSKIAGVPAWLVDVTGTLTRPPYGPARTVGVMVPMVNALWVYKLSGDLKVVDQEREAFLKLVEDWR